MSLKGAAGLTVGVSADERAACLHSLINAQYTPWLTHKWMKMFIWPKYISILYGFMWI